MDLGSDRAFGTLQARCDLGAVQPLVQVQVEHVAIVLGQLGWGVVHQGVGFQLLRSLMGALGQESLLVEVAVVPSLAPPVIGDLVLQDAAQPGGQAALWIEGLGLLDGGQEGGLDHILGGLMLPELLACQPDQLRPHALQGLG